MRREEHKAWNECQHIMSDLDKGMSCIQRRQELAIPIEDKGKLLAQRWGPLEDAHKHLKGALEMARVIGVMPEDNEEPILQ